MARSLCMLAALSAILRTASGMYACTMVGCGLRPQSSCNSGSVHCVWNASTQYCGVTDSFMRDARDVFWDTWRVGGSAFATFSNQMWSCSSNLAADMCPSPSCSWLSVGATSTNQCLPKLPGVPDSDWFSAYQKHVQCQNFDVKSNTERSQSSCTRDVTGCAWNAQLAAVLNLGAQDTSLFGGCLPADPNVLQLVFGCSVAPTSTVTTTTPVAASGALRAPASAALVIAAAGLAGSAGS